jgi:hypothetical protein
VMITGNGFHDGPPGVLSQPSASCRPQMSHAVGS